mgnify:CR=1 FL=1
MLRPGRRAKRPCSCLPVPTPPGGAVATSDVITIRRATVQPTPLEAGRLQIQSTRISGALFEDGAIPSGFLPADSATHNLVVNRMNSKLYVTHSGATANMLSVFDIDPQQNLMLSTMLTIGTNPFGLAYYERRLNN